MTSGGRKLLRPVDVTGTEVKCNYGELMILFDAIETKAKALRYENAKLRTEVTRFEFAWLEHTD